MTDSTTLGANYAGLFVGAGEAHVANDAGRGDGGRRENMAQCPVARRAGMRAGCPIGWSPALQVWQPRGWRCRVGSTCEMCGRLRCKIVNKDPMTGPMLLVFTTVVTTVMRTVMAMPV